MTVPMKKKRPARPHAVVGNVHSAWRAAMLRRLADEIDPERFGVRAVYVFGSTRSGTAGPRSNINLLIHLERGHPGKRELEVWLEGWSQSLDEMNYLRTGHRSKGLLDVHFVNDDDFRLKTTYARKVREAGAAKPLRLGSSSPMRDRSQPLPARLELFYG
jgi:hypothetical protein